MRLKPLPQRQASAELRGRIPGELHTALIAYTVYYRETLGQAIGIWPLIVRMVRQFLDTDREFQAWRRRPQNGPGGGAVKS
jgi:hypothetical protein